MNKIKQLSVLICLILLGAGMALLAGWDMHHAAAKPDAWYQGTYLPMPDAFYGSIQCPDDPEGFYVVAGWQAWFVNRDEVWHYDADTSFWIPLADYPEPMGIVSVTCYQGYLYAAGGNLEGNDTSWHFYRYEIASDTWTQLPDLPRNQNGAALAAWDGYLYMIGGDDAPVVPVDPTTQVDRYNLQTGTWEVNWGTPMPVAVLGTSLQAGQYVYFVGGLTVDYPINSDATLRYDLATDTWEVGPSFTSRRAMQALEITSHYLYASGGDANGGGPSDPTDLVERLDLSSWPGGSWENISDPLIAPRNANNGFCSEAVTGGEIWSVGGLEPGGDPTANTFYRPSEPCADFYFGDLQPEEMAITGMHGELVTYTLSIHNDGTQPDTYDITASAAWNTTYPLSIGPLDPGESQAILVSVEIPANANPGDSDTTVITATSLGDPTAADVATLTTSVAGWVAATPIPFGVGYYGFAQCPNQPNSFYVISGGYDVGMATNNVWRYDADTDIWNALEPISWSEIAPAAVCYGDQIYVVASQLQIYDIKTDRWMNLGAVPRQLYGLAMGVWDGKLYRVGGSEAEFYTPVPNVDVYDIATNQWDLDGGTPIPVAVFAPAFTQVGQYLYVVGGNSTDSPAHNVDLVQRYDMATDTWEQIDFPSARGMGFALAHNDNRLYAIGGDLDGNDYYEETNMVETLDLASWPDSNWEMYYDQFPYAMIGNSAGFCTEAITGGEIWSVAGLYLDDDGNVQTLDVNEYHQTGEPCVHYGVDLLDPPEGEAEIGHSIEYPLIITNTGTITDYYNLDISTDWGGSLNLLNLGGPGPVGPGKSIQVVIGVDVPLNVHVGDQGLSTITATSLRDPAIAKKVQITTKVIGNDILLSPDSLTGKGIYGETIAYTLTVKNIGDITDTVSLTYTGNTWEVLLPVTSFNLGIGESAEVIIYVSIPANAIIGDTDPLTLIATSTGNPLVADSSTLTSTAFWYRTLLPLALKN